MSEPHNSQSKTDTPTATEETAPRYKLFTREWWGFGKAGKKTGLDLLQVAAALSIPIIVAVMGLIYTASQSRSQQNAEEQRAKNQQQANEQQAEDTALQNYLDQMSTLLNDKDLLKSKEGDEVRTLARARTLTVLRRLDGKRKASVLSFLQEANLIKNFEAGSEGNNPVVSLNRADLSKADLASAELRGADLRGAVLPDANLVGADLLDADLSSGTTLITGIGVDTELSEADLSGAILIRANLVGADLRGAVLRASLSDADLGFANLSGADLQGASLDSANLALATLSGADLIDADLPNTNLNNAILNNTDLNNADLSTAKNLTQYQIEQAYGNKKTKLPPDLHRPEAWTANEQVETFDLLQVMLVLSVLVLLLLLLAGRVYWVVRRNPKK